MIEGLEVYESKICPGCGFHETLCDVEKHNFDPEFVQCGVCAAKDRYDRMMADKDDKARGPDPKPQRHDPADGRRLLMTYTGKATPPPK